ncbi:MAG: carbohydrate kinase [Chloroflexi bacterium]|nr:MAG: carbohydrate kinase [Chloroflexota bacterium]
MIVVCGEALIDMVTTGDGNRRPTPGGGPFNTARALARLDVPTAFLGHFSSDEFGRMLADQLAADGASLALATFGPEPTTIAVANIGRDGLAEYEFFIQGTSAPNLTPQRIPAELPVEVNAVHLGTLGLVLEPMALSLAELVRREHGKRLIMLDPNIRPMLATGPQYRPRLDSLISESTIVKASDADLAWLFPSLPLREAARALLACGPRLVVVTLGAEGAVGVNGDGEVKVAAPVVQVVDTIGAGDAFGAALLAWLNDHDRLSRDLRLDRDELRESLEFACLVASITCTRPGADPPRRAELV